MPSMTAADIYRSRFGEAAPRRAVNTKGFEQPEMGPLAQPERPEPTAPAPQIEAPPIVDLKLRQYTGDFVLPRGQRAGGQVRAVTDGDIEELALWALPRFQERHPRFTVDAAVALARMATGANGFKFIRTDNAVGLFLAQCTPWEPRATVFDIGVTGRKEDHPNQHTDFEVVRIYRAGLAWAQEIKAVEFRFISDCGYNLDAIAKRIGMDMDNRVILYRKALE